VVGRCVTSASAVYGPGIEGGEGGERFDLIVMNNV
jgi:hypothetical protein